MDVPERTGAPERGEKLRVQKHWNAKPCGTRSTRNPLGSQEYFDDLDKYRYGDYAPWLPRIMGFNDASGKKLLEVGIGQGSDLAQFAAGGARCFGIDLTENHIRITRQRFAQSHLQVELTRGDAEHLPFPDRSFDVVYSYGVIHHTPSIEAALKEMYRVLRPGGEARIMVYAKYSEFNAFVWLQGLFRLQFLRYGYAATISHWCEGTEWDNPVRVGRYSRRGLRRLLDNAGFHGARISKHLLTRGNIPILGQYLNAPALEWLGRLIGWNLVVRAHK